RQGGRPEGKNRAAQGTGEKTHRRWLRRRWRYFLECADGVSHVPREHSELAGTQLGERSVDGHADRAQRLDRGRQGAGHDRAGFSAAAGTREAGVGLFSQWEKKKNSLRIVSRAGRQARA